MIDIKEYCLVISSIINVPTYWLQNLKLLEAIQCFTTLSYAEKVPRTS